MTLTPAHYALAASVAALVVAAPIAMRTMNLPLPESDRSDDRKPTLVSSAKDEPVAPKSGGAQVGERDAFRKQGEHKLKAEAEKSRIAANERSRLDDKADTGVATATEVSPIAAPAVQGGKPGDMAGALGGATTTANVPAPPQSAPREEALRTVQKYLDIDASGRIAEQSAAIGKPALDARQIGMVASRDTDAVPPPYLGDDENRDRFASVEESPIRDVAKEPVSTFSLDVDTASYAFVRRALNEGRLPPKAAIRTEELINYFDYDYPRPETSAEPFKPSVTIFPSPWNTANKLVHVAIKGYEITGAERPRANIVLLADVSGSMAPADRLPLVKTAFRMMVDNLRPDDTIAIVTYASGSGIALEPTKASDKARIMSAIDALGAGGSTAGAQGIEDAYRLAEQSFDKSAVNRVILATDGDFNVGVTNLDDLKTLIERKREKGIFLSILGVGQGNYNDALMQTLAQNGNGVAAYADTLSEARRVLVDEASSSLFPIAKDVKIQVEWNPERIAQYRLIGYETRALRREDFNNDRVDAGDVGSGHTVTAIYEVTPVGAENLVVDALRYGKPGPKVAAAEPAAATAPVATQTSAATPASRELGFLKMRYKKPQSDVSVPLSLPIVDGNELGAVDRASRDVQFSTAVAGFAELLRGSPHVLSFDYDRVIALAEAARGNDPFGLRAEFVNLARTAKALRK